jgi:nucleotide-binding universal stress UspA family protein
LEAGDPGREILKLSGPTDLVVMTTHGDQGLKRLIRGSVAEKIIHGAAAAVFISKTRPRLEPTTAPRRDRRSRSSA